MIARHPRRLPRSSAIFGPADESTGESLPVLSVPSIPGITMSHNATAGRRARAARSAARPSAASATVYPSASSFPRRVRTDWLYNAGSCRWRSRRSVLERLTEPRDGAEADHGAGEDQEPEMDVDAAFVADR